MDNEDRERERFTSEILKQLKERHPNIAKSLTAKTKMVKAKECRKAKKLRILFEEHKSVACRIVKAVSNSPDFKTVKSVHMVSSIYNNIFPLYSEDALPGSVESKYDFGQGETE